MATKVRAWSTPNGGRGAQDMRKQKQAGQLLVVDRACDGGAMRRPLVERNGRRRQTMPSRRSVPALQRSGANT